MNASTPLAPIFQAYEEGRVAMLLSGRSLYDLIVAEDNKLRPILEALRRALFMRYGMVTIVYSLAGGLDWDSVRIRDNSDRKRIEQILQTHHLMNIPQDVNEVPRVIRGISSLSRVPTEGMKWSDGRNMRFCFLFEFTEHLTPGSLQNGTQTEIQMISSELAHITGQSLALRSSGNLIIFHGRESLVDRLVESALFPVRLRQPDQEEKKSFLSIASNLYPNVTFEEGLTIEAVSHLTTNTPNRGLEALIRASDRSGRKITSRELAEQKNRDVEELSEHTLTVLDRTRAKGIKLFGKNIATPQSILERFADLLLHGDQSIPANVLLVGSPGCGKTDLAIQTADRAKVAAYQMLSPKGGIVGETERKANIQQTVLKEWAPNIAFVDEITETFPLERSDHDLDAGATKAVSAALLTALSDETRRGKSILIATTNCPWRMGAAMRSRFIIIPVLAPLREDVPGIIVTTAQRVVPETDVNEKDPLVQEAADIFYSKGANPRHIRAALNNALLIHGNLTADTIRFAALDFCAPTDQHSAIYADLWAIRSCSSKSFFPWNDDPSSYPFPEYLNGIVDFSTGDIDSTALAKRIEELKAYANV